MTPGPANLYANDAVDELHTTGDSAGDEAELTEDVLVHLSRNGCPDGVSAASISASLRIDDNDVAVSKVETALGRLAAHGLARCEQDQQENKRWFATLTKKQSALQTAIKAFEASARTVEDYLELMDALRPVLFQGRTLISSMVEEAISQTVYRRAKTP